MTGQRKKGALEQRRKPAQPRAQATVAAILEASARILRREGRAAFNTNRIAELAGVSIGTLYGYFPDKEAIYIALARQIIDEDGREMMKVLDEDHGPETIRILIRRLLKRHRTDRDVRRTVMSFYVSSGFAAEHDRLVEETIRKLAAQPDRVFGREMQPIDPVRLFVVSRAVFGVARALTEQGDAVKDVPLDRLEDEVVGFIRHYLFGAS